MNLQFHYIEKLWQSFWSPKTPSSDGSTALPSRYTAVLWWFLNAPFFGGISSFENAWSIFSFIRHFECFAGLESICFPAESLQRVSEVFNIVMTAQSSVLRGKHLLWLCTSMCPVPPVTRANPKCRERLDGWDAFVNGQQEQTVTIPCW